MNAEVFRRQAMNTPFVQTMNLLTRSGIPLRVIDRSTVAYWLAVGYSPTRIAVEIYAVKELAS
jgi:hypothetical protein